MIYEKSVIIYFHTIENKLELNIATVSPWIIRNITKQQQVIGD